MNDTVNQEEDAHKRGEKTTVSSEYLCVCGFDCAVIFVKTKQVIFAV